jgi:hypothetical protein
VSYGGTVAARLGWKGDSSMTAGLAALRELLRSQQVFPDRMPEFDPNAAPDDPVRLQYRRAGGGWTRQLLWP